MVEMEELMCSKIKEEKSLLLGVCRVVGYLPFDPQLKSNRLRFNQI